MKVLSPTITILLALAGTGAHAADYGRVARDRYVRVTQPTQAIVRLATQGLGYSVLHQSPAPVFAPYRVHVTCTIDESYAETFCPTVNYDAYCPRAKIACR